MLKSGSKFLFGLAAFGTVAMLFFAAGTGGNKIGMDTLLGTFTFGYKGYVGEHTGFVVLAGLTASALFLGILLSALRDADPEAGAQVAGLEAVPEAVVPVSANYWPVVGAFSAGALALGLAFGSTLFVIGLVGLIIVVIEWTVSAWADRATGDPAVNRTIRNRLMYPVEIPAMAVLGVGGLVLAISRILLALPKIGGYLVFGLVPVVVLVVGAILVSKPKVSQSVIAGLLLVGGLAILGGGVAAAIVGERSHGDDHQEEDGEHDGEGESGSAPLPVPSKTVIRVGT